MPVENLLLHLLAQQIPKLNNVQQTRKLLKFSARQYQTYCMVVNLVLMGCERLLLLVFGDCIVAYLNFIKFKHTITDQFSSIFLINDRELLLLEIIELKHLAKEELTITEAMKISKCGSPATINRSLRVLVDAGLIDVFFKGKNRRTKYLAITEKTTQYFSSLGAALIQSTNQK